MEIQAHWRLVSVQESEIENVRDCGPDAAFLFVESRQELSPQQNPLVCSAQEIWAWDRHLGVAEASGKYEIVLDLADSFLLNNDVLLC